MKHPPDEQQQQRWSLAIHGGAGVINSTHTAWLEDARLGLEASLAAGQAVLEAGGSAIDAAVAAVEQLENDPHFNAGSVLSAHAVRAVDRFSLSSLC
jgi:beta-aspartyl-peptidase (threonine type)